jgi:hypothetical protein
MNKLSTKIYIKYIDTRIFFKRLTGIKLNGIDLGRVFAKWFSGNTRRSSSDELVPYSKVIPEPLHEPTGKIFTLKGKYSDD